MTTDHKKLRELAEVATQPWGSSVWFGTNEDSWTATGPIHDAPDDPYEPCDPDSETAKRAQLDSEFIAAASPDVVIALLDEIDRLRAKVADMRSERLRAEAQLAAAQAEIEMLRDHLRVSEEQNESLGDANVLSVQLAAALAAKDEACDLGSKLHNIARRARLDIPDPGDASNAAEIVSRIAALRTIGKGNGNG